MPVGECRKLLVELQALRLRATALEEIVAGYVSAVGGPGRGGARTGRPVAARELSVRTRGSGDLAIVLLHRLVASGTSRFG